VSYSFSFVIPVHNGIPYIQDCIKSILSQTHTDFNIIVLENQSTDTTKKYIYSLNNDKIQIIESNSLLTIEQNFSRILNTKRNEFTVIVCADDMYKSDYLSLIIELINKYPDATLYRTQMEVINEKNETIAKPYIKNETMTEEDYLYGRLKHTYFETIAGYCFRTKDYNDIGGIKCIHKLMHTDDVLLMELARKSYLAVSSQYGAFYRTHVNSVSRTCNQQVALEGFNYFLNWIYDSKNEKLYKIVRKNLTFHLHMISHFFDTKYMAEMKKMYKLYWLNSVYERLRYFSFKLLKFINRIVNKFKRILSKIKKI
jgi:glycosyltransferase involved in cell wall biosynthesis